MRPLSRRYLILTQVPYYVDAGGGVWLERLWHHDFVEHLRYLPRATLAAPRLEKHEGADLAPLRVPDGVELSFVPLPKVESLSAGIARLPEVALRLWRATDDADVVYSGVVGWPIPVGWIGNTIALVRGRKLALIVESAPWRASGASGEGLKHRVREVVTEGLARFFVRRAHVNLFTQPEYQRTLAEKPTGACYVTPASWINAEDIARKDTARARWADKREGLVRLLFAGRLATAKGIDVLLAALEHEHPDVCVDVIGEGPRRDACVAASKSGRLRLLDPLPYGPEFFALLAGYHAVLVPSLGDEQPRILFDAFAQAIPVIGSATDGITPHVRHDGTGWLVRPGDAADLAGAIARAAREPERLEEMGMNALAEAPRFTHRGMHEERWRIFRGAFGA